MCKMSILLFEAQKLKALERYKIAGWTHATLAVREKNIGEECAFRLLCRRQYFICTPSYNDYYPIQKLNLLARVPALLCLTK